MMDCCVSRREIEGEKRGGEADEGKTRALYRDRTGEEECSGSEGGRG